MVEFKEENMIKKDYFYEDYRLPEFYDCVYGEIKHDIPFWVDSVGTSTDILELACGTGRITLELAKNKNLRIDALDFSKEMLDRLRNKSMAFNNINIIEGDMRYFTTDKLYDKVFITSNSLNHIETRDDIDKVFKGIRRHLKTDGFLIFDILNPLFKYLTRDLNGKYEEQIFKFDKDRYFKMWENNIYHYDSQINTVTYFYQFCNSEGKSINNHIYEQKIKVRLFYPQEMDYIIEKNGFQIMEKYDWYNKKTFEGKTGEQIYLLRKID
jgi:ubiquinone/menaquinone biosynthesis C-methylase UbiE